MAATASSQPASPSIPAALPRPLSSHINTRTVSKPAQTSQPTLSSIPSSTSKRASSNSPALAPAILPLHQAALQHSQPYSSQSYSQPSSPAYAHPSTRSPHPAPASPSPPAPIQPKQEPQQPPPLSSSIPSSPAPPSRPTPPSSNRSTPPGSPYPPQQQQQQHQAYRYPSHLYRAPSYAQNRSIMIDPTDPVRRYQPAQQVQLKLSNGQWITATITEISRASPNAATQTYTVEYVSGGRRECTSVGPSYLRPSS